MTVDVFVTMGNATVRIPDDWVVDATALPVMGAIEEERFPRPSRGSVPDASKDNQVSRPPRPSRRRRLLGRRPVCGCVAL